MKHATLAIALVLGALAVASVSAAPAWTQSGVFTFTPTGDGTTVDTMVGSTYTSAAVLTLGVNTLYNYNIFGYHANGLTGDVTFGIKVAGTWVPVIGPIDQYSGPGNTAGRKDLNVKLSAQVTAVNSVTGAVTVHVAGTLGWSDNYYDVIVVGASQTVSVTVTAVTGTVTFLPCMIGPSNEAINIDMANMVTS